MRIGMAAYVTALVGSSTLAACTETAGTPGPQHPSELDGDDMQAVAGPGAPSVPCLSEPVERWTGSAERVQENYPDNIRVTTTWQRVETDGCVDRYRPVGTAQYHFAVPGAQCTQPSQLTPRERPVATTDGLLEIDRSTSPPTFSGQASTTWSVTWSCPISESETATQTFEGGGRWLRSSGQVIGGAIAGSATFEDGAECGNQPAGTWCEYTWSFTPAP